jgi:Beta-lactamase class C and other penicillin binding proteins
MNTKFILLWSVAYCLTSLQSYSENKYTLLDERIDSIMKIHNLPGVQVAVVHKENIVYKKSYGWADVDNKIVVSDSSLFRIASISKPITMAAILKLIDGNKLRKDQLVFGEQGILTLDYEVPDSGMVKQITVQHLLNHRSGWVNEPTDPMFWDSRFTKQQIIQKILSTRKLKYAPGTQDSYSNFGYCILGCIIEKITGMSYEDYVKQEILSPCGIVNMKIGKDKYDDRSFNEVTYYARENAGVYDLPVSRLSSVGGWIASATDLVNFLVHVDRNNKKADIISIKSMEDTYFVFERWDHSGSLPGTMTYISRFNDEWGYAILINTRTLDDGTIFGDITKVMGACISDWAQN